jgi:hypothetical protein
MKYHMLAPTVERSKARHSCFGPLEHWERQFESRSMHGWMYACLCFAVLCSYKPCDGPIPRLRNPTKISEVNSEPEQAKEPNKLNFT